MKALGFLILGLFLLAGCSQDKGGKSIRFKDGKAATENMDAVLKSMGLCTAKISEVTTGVELKDYAVDINCNYDLARLNEVEQVLNGVQAELNSSASGPLSISQTNYMTAIGNAVRKAQEKVSSVRQFEAQKKKDRAEIGDVRAQLEARLSDLEKAGCKVNRTTYDFSEIKCSGSTSYVEIENKRALIKSMLEVSGRYSTMASNIGEKDQYSKLHASGWSSLTPDSALQSDLAELKKSNISKLEQINANLMSAGISTQVVVTELSLEATASDRDLAMIAANKVAKHLLKIAGRDFPVKRINISNEDSNYPFYFYARGLPIAITVSFNFDENKLDVAIAQIPNATEIDAVNEIINKLKEENKIDVDCTAWISIPSVSAKICNKTVMILNELKDTYELSGKRILVYSNTYGHETSIYAPNLQDSYVGLYVADNRVTKDDIIKAFDGAKIPKK